MANVHIPLLTNVLSTIMIVHKKVTRNGPIQHLVEDMLCVAVVNCVGLIESNAT